MVQMGWPGSLLPCSPRTSSVGEAGPVELQEELSTPTTKCAVAGVSPFCVELQAPCALTPFSPLGRPGTQLELTAGCAVNPCSPPQASPCIPPC